LPSFIQSHLAAFRYPEDAIVYAPIQVIDEQGRARNQRLFHAISNPALQAIGRNQVPSCCMFRRSFWERAGGYDGRYTPAEDAQLWLKIFSLGGKPVRATTASQMEYRAHGDLLSAKGFSDWWTVHAIRYELPIVERDPQITVVLIQSKVHNKPYGHSKIRITQTERCCRRANAGESQEGLSWLNRSPSRCAASCTSRPERSCDPATCANTCSKRRNGRASKTAIPVTVVVPTWLRDELDVAWLLEAVESVLDQTVHVPVIIVENGSEMLRSDGDSRGPDHPLGQRPGCACNAGILASDTEFFPIGLQ
jgi:hypothetical protein